VSLSIQFAGKTLFGPFELDNETAELFRDGQQVRLSRQSALLLVILVQRAGLLVPREELRVTLWPEDTYVDFDHGLNNCISRIRQALGDAVDLPNYIQTLPKQGYRFIGKVSPAMGQVNHSDSPSSLGGVNSATDIQKISARDAVTERIQPSKTLGGFWNTRNRGLAIALAVCACSVLLLVDDIYLLKPPAPRVEGFRVGPYGVDVQSPLWSPDGKAFVYVAKANGRDQLFLRYLNSPVGIQLSHLPHDQTGFLIPSDGQMTGVTFFLQSNRIYSCRVCSVFTRLRQ
jgi:DNA-binding winged helix-turn-helix (wHTH) protein